MNPFTRPNLLGTSLIVLALFQPTHANEVEILAADFRPGSDNHWSVNVTLKHGDTGWDHYADNWRVVDVDGKILGDRVLYHPHVNEQPFTRSLNQVKIPKETGFVYIEAHDKLHGWTSKRLKIDLNKLRDKNQRK